MPAPQVTQTQWNSLPKETRQKIVALFSLPKTGVVMMEFINGYHEMKCDGHSNADLALMTVEKMQEATSSTETDPGKLLQALATLIESEPQAEPEPAPEAPIEAPSAPPEPEGRTKTCCGSKGTRHMKFCATLVKA